MVAPERLDCFRRNTLAARNLDPASAMAAASSGVKGSGAPAASASMKRADRPESQVATY
jgi:hypothetical protein